MRRRDMNQHAGTPNRSVLELLEPRLLLSADLPGTLYDKVGADASDANDSPGQARGFRSGEVLVAFQPGTGGSRAEDASQAKALLPTDRERALALFQEAEPLLSAGLTGMGEDPRRGSLENKRRALERTVTIFEFWHNVAPDRGWAERAAEWRTELEELRGP